MSRYPHPLCPSRTKDVSLPAAHISTTRVRVPGPRLPAMTSTLSEVSRRSSICLGPWSSACTGSSRAPGQVIFARLPHIARRQDGGEPLQVASLGAPPPIQIQFAIVALEFALTLTE